MTYVIGDFVIVDLMDLDCGFGLGDLMDLDWDLVWANGFHESHGFGK